MKPKPLSSDSPFGDLTGRRAVVIGGSSGIGRAIAIELARGGADILVHYGQSRGRAQETCEQIQAVGQHAKVIEANLLDTNQMNQLVPRILADWGPFDLWVQNAGVDLLTGDGPRLSYSEKLSRLLAVDVSAGVLLTKAAGESLRATAGGRGCILTIGWDQADRGMEGDSAELFSTAKNAIMGYTRSLAMSLAPEVRVNCIAPGWIRTAWGESAPAAWQERVLRETPLRRWGTPEDIAQAARFLASESAAYITGQVINVNGGAIR